MDSGKRVMNGTYGQVWLDGEEVSECISCKAESSFSKSKVYLSGQLEEENKITSISNTGSLKFHKVNSRMLTKIGDAISKGKDLRFTVISKLADPDAYGAERIALYNVSFDKVTLADWTRAQTTDIEAPFTFGKFKLLDTVK